MLNKYAFYQMSNNKYLGNCICIVYKTCEEERLIDGMCGEFITIYIKAPFSKTEEQNTDGCISPI